MNSIHFKSPETMLKQYFILGFCFLIASGLWAQTPVITPLHNEAHDIVLGAGFGNYSINSFVSYSPIKNVGILFQSVECNIYHNDWRALDRSLKLSTGYYGELVPKLIFELYGGVSYYKYGSLEIISIMPVESYIIEGTAFAYFLQPSIGYRSNNFQLSFATRFSNRLYELNIASSPNLSYLGDKVLIEPSLNIAWGFEKLKFHFQTGILYNGVQSIHNFGRMQAQMGMQLQLNALNFKKKTRD